MRLTVKLDGEGYMLGCFIILNYKDYKITQKAVSCLRRLKDIEKCYIIIYDNGSQNNSIKILSEKYNGIDNIIVTGSDVNLGFSEGNNCAYKIAKQLDPDLRFVVAMNSDLMIHQVNFIARINEYVVKDYYSIIGPDVYNSHLKWHQSPLYVKIPSQEKIEEMITLYESRLADLSKAASERQKSDKKAKLASRIPYSFISLYRKMKHVQYDYDYKKIYDNPVISGACIVFLKKYIQNEDLLFEPDTFLYCEELLLTIKCKRRGYAILYDPRLSVLHRESVSTKADMRSYQEYVKRESEYMIRAFRIVLDEIKKDK